jgi:GxxExxY protein
MNINELTEIIIGAAIEVDNALGPGLRDLPISYKGVQLDCGYKLDLVVENIVVVELKSVDSLHPIHEAQLLTYLRLGGWNVGLLLNFNVAVLKDGIRRRVHGLKE